MIRVAIVDDHALVRAGLQHLLSDEVDINVVALAATGREAVEIARQATVDVILLDISLPDQSGIDTLAAIKARAPSLAVLMLSGFPEQHYATTVIRQGAAGYLAKDCDPADIAEAIRTVAGGRRYISRAVAQELADGLLTGNNIAPDHAQLSEREFQVFLHLAKGQTVAQIAQSICLSTKTISTYRARVMEKMCLESNSDLTYYALKNGLIS